MDARASCLNLRQPRFIEREELVWFRGMALAVSGQ